jgi:tetratricopeptide (TPR) repeat protein
VRHGDSLSERSRLRAKASLALVQTDGVAAAEALGRILQIDSTDIDAWEGLAYCHLVYGWQYRAGEREAMAAAEHAVRLDSTDAPALVTRAMLTEAGENRDALAGELEALRRADTSLSLVRGAVMRLRALLLSDGQFPAFADSAVRRPPPEWLAALRGLRSYRPERAELLLARARAAAGPGLPARIALGASVQLAVAEGRLREVDSTLRGGGYDERGFARTVDLFLLGSAIAGIGDSTVTHRVIGALAAFVPLDSAGAYFQNRPVWSTGWALGAYYASLGDTTLARRWWKVVGTLPPGGTSRDYRGAIQADIDARLEARRGELTQALRDGRRAYDLWTIHTDNQYEAFPEPAMRFHLASLLAATGHPESAAALFHSLVPPTTWMGFYTARASLALGQLAEARGDQTVAALYYGRALALWNRGESEVKPWRDQAAIGLQRVVGEARR